MTEMMETAVELAIGAGLFAVVWWGWTGRWPWIRP
jgi:hypothetical protein